MVQGTQLIMNCSVSVSSAVDTEFSVSISWSSQTERVLSGPSVIISDMGGSGHQFHKTVTISQVDLTDSAVYTCTASVSPVIVPTTGVMGSDESTDSVNITVKGEFETIIVIQCSALFCLSCCLSLCPPHIFSLTRANTTNCCGRQHHFTGWPATLY